MIVTQLGFTDAAGERALAAGFPESWLEVEAPDFVGSFPWDAESPMSSDVEADGEE